jgi:hypothetical protein
MTGHLEKVPLAPSQFKGGIAKDLEEVILKAIEKQPEKRYQSAQEMSEALSRIKSGSGTAVAGDEQFAKTTAVPIHPKVGGVKTKMLIPALAVFVIVVVAVLWLFMRGGGGEQKAGAQTFADSLATGRALFSQKNYGEAAALFSVLKKSVNASRIDKSEALRYEAASRLQSGDSVAARTLFAEVHRVDPAAGFPAEKFGTAVAESWSLFGKPVSSNLSTHQTGSATDTAAGRTNPPPQQKPASITTGSLAVTVDNYKIFEPVTIIFDGKSERYQGSPVVFENLAAGMHEVTVATDLGKLTNQVQTQGDRKECSFTLSERLSSKLTVTSLVADNADDIVPAQVYIDNDKIEDGQTPFSTKLMNGPHKVWVEDKNYRTEGKPRFVTLSGDTQMEFVLRKK